MEKNTNIYKALADFQQECPVIHKGTQGYGYSYADLPAIFEIINPLLKKNGLGFTQLVNGQHIETILFHIESGETINSITDIPQDVILRGQNPYQTLGSAITYIRRYALSSMLGIVTDKDTDAGGEEAKKENKPELPVKWMNEAQFKKAKQSDDEIIEKTLAYYDGKTIHNDNGKEFKASMKKAYKKELQQILIENKKI